MKISSAVAGAAIRETANTRACGCGSGPVAAMKIDVRVLLPRAGPGDRAHACLRRGSGPVARPSTTVLLPTTRAISTTDRRLTSRPCNLSRADPSPRRCAARCRPRGPDGKTARATTISFKGVAGLPAAASRPSTTESRMDGGAISTTRRRSTIRPYNLSRAVTQPASLRCALPSSRDRFSRCQATHSSEGAGTRLDASL